MKAPIESLRPGEAGLHSHEIQEAMAHSSADITRCTELAPLAKTLVLPCESKETAVKILVLTEEEIAGAAVDELRAAYRELELGDLCRAGFRIVTFPAPPSPRRAHPGSGPPSRSTAAPAEPLAP